MYPITTEYPPNQLFFEFPKHLKAPISIHFCNSFVCRGVKMNGRKKILIALFSALVLLVAVTLTGCFGDEEG